MLRKMVVAGLFLMSVVLVGAVIFLVTHLTTYPGYVKWLLWPVAQLQAPRLSIAKLEFPLTPAGGTPVFSGQELEKQLLAQYPQLKVTEPTPNSQRYLLSSLAPQKYYEARFKEPNQQGLVELSGPAILLGQTALTERQSMAEILQTLGEPSLILMDNMLGVDSEVGASEYYALSLWYCLNRGQALEVERLHYTDPLLCRTHFRLHLAGRRDLWNCLENLNGQRQLLELEGLKQYPQMLQDNLGLARTRELALKGDKWSQWRLAYCYEKGIGLKKSIPQALRWYRSSALQGCPKAQYSLSQYYALGKHLPKDEAKALELCSLAAFNGVAQAQYVLAVRYERGSGVAMDIATARGWYEKAAKQGLGKAQAALERLNQGR